MYSDSSTDEKQEENDVCTDNLVSLELVFFHMLPQMALGALHINHLQDQVVAVEARGVDHRDPAVLVSEDLSVQRKWVRSSSSWSVIKRIPWGSKWTKVGITIVSISGKTIAHATSPHWAPWSTLCTSRCTWFRM